MTAEENLTWSNCSANIQSDGVLGYAAVILVLMFTVRTSVKYWYFFNSFF